jgi:antitoxin component YwqK of YwqJK toxin-antitoxin module
MNLLVRLDYQDLQNVLEVFPKLHKITETQHFQDAWKVYNVKTCIDWQTTLEGKKKHVVDHDRNGVRHGQYKIYEENLKPTYSCNYKQDKLHGKVIRYHYGSATSYTYTTYDNGEKYGPSVEILDDSTHHTHKKTYFSDNGGYTLCFWHDRKTDSRCILEYRNGVPHGIRVSETVYR